jgi:hypothetical protein
MEKIEQMIKPVRLRFFWLAGASAGWFRQKKPD